MKDLVGVFFDVLMFGNYQCLNFLNLGGNEERNMYIKEIK